MPRIKIDPQILAEWSRLAAEGLTRLDMSLSSATAADECIAAINDAVNALVADHNTTIEATRPMPGQEPPWPGEWHMIELADGSVGIRVLECERADVFVPTVVDALERAGIAGKLASLRWPVVPAPPAPALVLELKMLVRGHRFHKRGRVYGWDPDRSSRDWLIELAATWLRNSGNERSAPALTVSVLPTVSLTPSDDVAARILGNLDELNHINARIATGSGFRIITWAPNTQQVGLIHVSDREWKQPLVGLRQALVDAAGRIAYGYIKRGKSPAAARKGYSLADDWWPRDGLSEDHVYRASTSSYDEYAPDAFGIQLLGPGYDGRIPTSRQYNQRSIADAALLEHSAPAAWFETPFVKPAHDPRDIAAQAPTVLEQARVELEPILFRPEVIPDV